MAVCKEEEYPVKGICCPKCSPGYRVKHDCKMYGGTVCTPCDPETYTAHLNGLRECLMCQKCDSAMGLVTRRHCSTTENTVCGCEQGHFCSIKDGDNCAKCQLHKVCNPGQRIQQRGTEWQDTICMDCSPGTFSPNGSLEECHPWTNCSGTFQYKSKPGTKSTDATCSLKVTEICFIFGSPAVIGLIAFVVCIFKKGGCPFSMCHCRETYSRKQKSQNVEGDHSATQPLQGVTTVAEKETVLEFLDQRPKDAAV